MRAGVAAALALACVLSPVLALADDDVSVVDNSRLDEIYVQVHDISGRVDAMAAADSVGSTDVTTRLDGVSADLQGVSSGVDAANQTLSGIDADVDGISTKQDEQSGKIDGIDKKLEAQAQTLREVSDAVNAEPEYEVPEQVDFDELLELLPEGSPEVFAEYMMHPFMWGMCAGIVGYIITLIQAAIYRLLGFR